MATTTTVEGPIRSTLRSLREPGTPESKSWALTSLRRTHLDNQKIIKTLNDEEFCELCNSIIDLGVTESVSEKLHTEACRTLDTILPETQNKNFDFFKSIQQINRKKRLKILVSLSILKDETVAIIANKLSILEFLRDCMDSIQPKTMNWLLPENSDNETVVKNADKRALNASEEFEEKVVERSLELLHRLCELSSFGLHIQQFDAFIMDKIVLLAYMGSSKQRTKALIILQQAAKNDLGTRVRSFHKDIWDEYKTTLQNVYCKRMILLVNLSNMDWAIQWETSLTLIGTDLHKGAALVNSLLKVEEFAFKSADDNRRQAFLSWKLLIDNFALDPRELATARRIKLLCVPLNAKNSKNELMVLTKMEVWWHLICQIYSSLTECINSVLLPFLTLCFGPFGEKPLFIQNCDSNIALGKKFDQTRMFSIATLVQLIVSKEDQPKISINIKFESLPYPVKSFVFEKVYKIFIHCFGESIITLGLLSDDIIKNKFDICKIMWDNLIKRIEEYDKMKAPMYKEILDVIVELIKKKYHEIPLIKEFLLKVVLKNFKSIANNVQFTENILLALTDVFLQVDNMSYFTHDHYQHLESLLWHLIKPSSADVYNPKSLEMIQNILNIIDEAAKIDSHTSQACEIWCILAKIAKKYIEDSQNINEGTLLEPNFKTIEGLISFPFTSLVTDDFHQVKHIEAWCNLYKQFDFQAELIVIVKPNEILERTSKMIITSLHNDKMCQDFAAVCIDALLDVVNYDNLPSDKEVPEFVNLLKNLTVKCIETKSYATDKILKALSSFLLRIFNHSMEKTAHYLKSVKPAINFIITKLDDKNFESDVLNVWTTIVGLFKKLQKSFNYELLNCYRQTITAAAKNRVTSEATRSILDVRDHIDEKTKKLLEDLIKEFDQSSMLNNIEIIEPRERLRKRAPTPVGSFLNRKSMSPSKAIVQNGKDNIVKSKVVNIEPDSQDFVVINTDVNLDVNRLTEHQKERLKKRRDDIPAMYNELSISNSQDSQQLQQWFSRKTGNLSNSQKKETILNNNEMAKSTPTLRFQIKAFNKIAQELIPIEPENEQEKPATPCKSISSSSSVCGAGSSGCSSNSRASPKAVQKQQQQQQLQEVEKEGVEQVEVEKAIGESPRKKEAAEPAPSVAKRLDFETPDAEEEDQEDKEGEKKSKEKEAEVEAIEDTLSSSSSESLRMRRKNLVDEITGSGAAQQQKIVQNTRRLLQPALREGLRKFNSADQLVNKRGRKRRNSDSNSESMLSIVRVSKRPRVTESMEVLNSCDSDKSEDSNASSSDADAKKNNLSKRQLSEISRLKIDMRFEPLPNRRSVSKSNENLVADSKKSTNKEERTKEDKEKPVSTAKAKEDKSPTPVKRDGRTTPSFTAKLESNSQQSQCVVITRRSLKSVGSAKADTIESGTKVQEMAYGKKDSGNRKSNVIVDNSGVLNKATARKSLLGKIDSGPFKKKMESLAQETQEIFEIEDVTTQVDNSQKSAKNTELSKADSSLSEARLSQDPDIVESSQEPSVSAKFDKPECFIKIKKVELLQNSAVAEQVPDALEKSANLHNKIIQETPLDSEDKSVSIVQVITDSERPILVQTESRKLENSTSKPIANHNSSPKSSHPRIFKSKNFSLSGRAAQMLGLVTKQSISEKYSSSEPTKIDFNLSDEITLVPLKKDKPIKESDRVASPISSRQEKMFNNMNNLNNLKQPDRCSSPSVMMFCNLKNDGERISPKLERHQLEKESEIVEKESSPNEISDASDDSPKKRELPILEWSNANPPSLTASPSASILKRLQECEVETPNSRKKRVSFADPPVSRKMEYEIMTETSSPPRLEKLPTIARSPISRKDLKRQRRRVDRENDLNCTDDKLTNNEIFDETNICNNLSISLSPKVKLTTIISKVLSDESKTTSPDVISVSQTQDMFEDTSAPTNDVVATKTSTQNDPNNSSIKIDSINLSHILSKSDKNQSLEDTVDVNNMSSSLESNHSSSGKMSSNCFQNSKEPGDTLPVTDSVFSNTALTQESQNNIAQLNKPELLESTLPIYPSLTSCNDAIDSIRAELVEPIFADSLAKYLSTNAVRSVGDLAQLTEREINRLPIGGRKVDTVKKVLARYAESLSTKTPEKKMKASSGVSSSTPLGNRRRDNKNRLENELFNEFNKSNSSSDLDSANNSYENKRRSPKRSLSDNSMQTSPVKRLKKDDEKNFDELMMQCDEDFLMDRFVKKFDFEKVRKAYKKDDDSLLNECVEKFDFEKVSQCYNVDSSKLLSLLAKNLAEQKGEKADRQTLSAAEIEVLLNIGLENGVNELSNSAKRTLLKNFVNKFNTCDLFDVCADILKTLKLKTC